jgi:transcription elongation factor GreA
MLLYWSRSRGFGTPAPAALQFFSEHFDSPEALVGRAAKAALTCCPLARPESDEYQAMEKIPMTAQGFAALEAEIKHLKQVERPAIIKAISEARAHGDLSENAEYHSAKERQSFIEGRVMELEDKVSRAQVIDVSKLSGKTVKFGATVSVVDEDTEQKSKFQIVGDIEADFAKGRISLSSPLARALIGKSVGDTVEVNTPSGGRTYEITKVEYK